jgi:hypothetical protein
MNGCKLVSVDVIFRGIRIGYNCVTIEPCIWRLLTELKVKKIMAYQK